MQIIRASEIGEFYYCCLAWLFRKKGFKPQSSQKIEKKLEKEKKPEERIKLIKQLHISKKTEKNLEEGLKKHKEVGEKISYVQTQETKINLMKYIGYGILIVVVAIIIYFLIK